MQLSRRNFLKLSGITALSVSLGGTLLSRMAALPAQASAFISPELHVLNRVTWGIHPNHMQLIKEMGIARYVEWQLDHENIPDPVMDSFYAEHPMLQMTAADIWRLAQEDPDYGYVIPYWARIYRAVYSERQLFERMVEFWTDHFNVPIGDLLGEKIVDDREVIRRNALGKFRDLLLASAQSPAMLYYLNQSSSSAEHPNENYARELMELHTLGVDGGYSEADVKEVARAFTGWTVRDGWADGFYFDIAMHDGGEKTILGYALPAGRGIEDGLQVLDILATHPSTAHFVSYKLCRRFISDTPPDSIVQSTTSVFVQSEGDLKQVMRHILNSPEFAASAGQKFRRPLDYFVAMLRALSPGLKIQPIAYWIAFALEELGQLPYNWGPPNGYPDAAGAWMSTHGLLGRWNLGLVFPQTSEGWIDGIELELGAVIARADTAGELLDAAATAVLGSSEQLSPEDRTALLTFVTEDGNEAHRLEDWERRDKLATLLGLIFASPYFQWH